MNKPINKILYSIIESLTGYDLTDDFKIDPEYILDKIHDTRASMIAEEWRNKMLDDAYYQKVCCIEIECTETTCTVGGVSLPSGTKEFYVDLPGLNNRIEWDNIAYLGTVDMNNNFNRKTFDGLMALQGNRWTANQAAYTIVGNRAFIKNLPTSGTLFLCLVAVLDNPVVACDYNEETNPYPVPDAIKLELRVKQDILSTYGLPKDKQQDSQEAISQPNQLSDSQKQVNQQSNQSQQQ